VAIPYGTTDLGLIRALPAWQDAAGIAKGAVLRRIGIDPGTVARIIQTRAAHAGFDSRLLGSHRLKRGVLSTGMARGVHPTRLKQLGRHKSYSVHSVYLELGDLATLAMNETEPPSAAPDEASAKPARPHGFYR
jgi:hypothetical protein